MLYLPNGYVNMPWILSRGLPLIYVIGGRGTGKTYGALDTAIHDDRQFILLRRTQIDVENMSVPEMNPFNRLNKDNGWDFVIAPIIKQTYGIYHSSVDDAGLIKPQGAPIAPVLSLTSIAHSRGFGGDDKDLMIYDEFVPERHLREIRDEGDAVLNAYETINRNRELDGHKPLQMLCMSNSERLDNPVFATMGLISKAERMQRTGQEISIDTERGIMLIVLQHSPISERKKDTAIYRATKGTAFASMAVGNEFRDISDLSVKKVNIKEYTPIVSLDELTVYRHKSNGEYYVCFFRSGTPPQFGDTEIERKRAFKAFNYVWQAYFRSNVYFENSTCEVLFNRYFAP